MGNHKEDIYILSPHTGIYICAFCGPAAKIEIVAKWVDRSRLLYYVIGDVMRDQNLLSVCSFNFRSLMHEMTIKLVKQIKTRL